MAVKVKLNSRGHSAAILHTGYDYFSRDISVKHDLIARAEVSVKVGYLRDKLLGGIGVNNLCDAVLGKICKAIIKIREG